MGPAVQGRSTAGTGAQHDPAAAGQSMDSGRTGGRRTFVACPRSPHRRRRLSARWKHRPSSVRLCTRRSDAWWAARNGRRRFAAGAVRRDVGSRRHGLVPTGRDRGRRRGRGRHRHLPRGVAAAAAPASQAGSPRAHSAHRRGGLRHLVGRGSGVLPAGAVRGRRVRPGLRRLGGGGSPARWSGLRGAVSDRSCVEERPPFAPCVRRRIHGLVGCVRPSGRAPRRSSTITTHRS